MGSIRDVVTSRTSDESHRVTTLELLFDLVFVFAFTQVSRLMADTHSAVGVLQALVVLGILWWSWVSYSWLANQAHADTGIVRVAMIVAMTAMFILSLVIPESYHDAGGGLFAPVVVAICYTIVRLVHGATYVVAAGSDSRLRRQVIITLTASTVPSSTLFIIGALLGSPWQVWIWTIAFAADVVLVYVTSTGGDWRVNSAVHFAERYGLIVILALGESVVAIGSGAAREAISGAVVAGAILAIGLAVALWWAYFVRLAPQAEHALSASTGVRRAQLATDSFTYLHFAIVAGIILCAVGVELAMEQIGAGHEQLGLFGATALCAGIALYLSSSAFFFRRLVGRWLVPRLLAAVTLVAAIVLVELLPALAALGVVLVIVIASQIAEGIVASRSVGSRSAGSGPASSGSVESRPAATRPR